MGLWYLKDVALCKQAIVELTLVQFMKIEEFCYMIIFTNICHIFKGKKI